MEIKNTHLKNKGIGAALCVVLSLLALVFIFLDSVSTVYATEHSVDRNPSDSSDSSVSEDTNTYSVSIIDYFTCYQDKSYKNHVCVTNMSMNITLSSNLRPVFVLHEGIGYDGNNWIHLLFCNLDLDSGRLLCDSSDIPMRVVKTSPSTGDLLSETDATFHLVYTNHDFQDLYNVTAPYVTGIPVYKFSDDEYTAVQTPNGCIVEGIADGSRVPFSGSPWIDSDISSDSIPGTFNSSVPAPIIKHADIQYSATATSELYTILFDWEHDVSNIPIEDSEAVLSGLQTEIWVRTPYDSDGSKTTLQKIDSGDISKYFDSATGKFGVSFTDEQIATILSDKIDADYTYILEKVFRDKRKVRFYVRNVKDSDTGLLCSGYSYFDFISTAIEKDITINKNTNEPIDNDGSNDSNSSIEHEGNDGRPSGGGSLPGRGEWTTGDLKDFIDNGFYLTGDNGIVALIGNVLTFIPPVVFDLLFFFLGACVVIAVIKLIF